MMETRLGLIPTDCERPERLKFAWPLILLPDLFSTARHLAVARGYFASLGWEVYTPDLRAAAKQLDAALSPAESQAILDAERHLHDQTRAAMEAARQQFEASLPAARRAQIDARMAARKGNEQNGSRHEWKPDAGRALLEVALDFGRPPHRFGAPGGQPPGPQ